MNPLNIEKLAKAAKMHPRQLHALLAMTNGLALAARDAEVSKPDVMLRGLTPAVGATNVYPRYVGATNVQPMYPGRVGVPAAFDPAGAPGQGAVQYSPQAYTSGDVTFFGIGRTTIPAGSTGTTFNVKPPRPCAPQMFICKSNVQNLLVLSISIAGTNILNGQGGVPIELFSEVSQAPQILYPSIDPSTGVDFTVSNPTGGDLVFSGAFYGTQVRV
jgi:hypothetical protein